MNKDLATIPTGILQTDDSEYVRLVSLISDTWEQAKGRAALAVNTELIEASWQTGRYIVEFEQGGNTKARYGEQLISNLAKDLTRLKGRGFSRSNLIYMRKFYLVFPKSETLSHRLHLMPFIRKGIRCRRLRILYVTHMYWSLRGFHSESVTKRKI